MNEIYKIKIGDELQLNEKFIERYQPPQRLIDHIFVVLDIDGNIIYVDENVFQNFQPKNVLIRLWVKPYINNDTEHVKQQNKPRQEILSKPKQQTKSVKEISYKSKPKTRKDTDIVSEFFQIN